MSRWQDRGRDRGYYTVRSGDQQWIFSDYLKAALKCCLLKANGEEQGMYNQFGEKL